MKVAAGQIRMIVRKAIGSKDQRASVKEVRDLVKEEAEYAVAVDRLFGKPEQPVLRLKRRG